MLHSLKPEHFVIYGDGFMSLAHYRVTATGEIEQGFACFCSTTCLPLWEHSRMMGLVQ
jgi:hypothetical protein